MSGSPEGEVLIDGHSHIGVDVMFYLRGHYPYALDWPSLVRQGAAQGVDGFVVFPMVTHLMFNLAACREGKLEASGGLEKIPYAFENRRHMVEIERRFPALARRAYPLWMIDPSREQKAQVVELKRLHEEFRCSGLKIQATIIQSRVIDLLGEGACLLDLAEEKNWPVLIHTSILPADCWSQVADIVEVAKVRPGVRFCFAHSCRFDRPGLDAVAELPNAWFDCSAHCIHCELAVDDHPAVAVPERRFPANYRDPSAVFAALADAYPGKLIWGSDAPFESYADEDFSLISTYKAEADVLQAVDASLRRKVGRENVLAFLGETRLQALE